MVSGGAPLNPDIGIFFHSLGLTLLQGYGQTEAGPVISCNRPRAGLKMDTVGPPLKNTEVRIADDGEILVRGELVMKGYWRNERETDRVLADDWLHTGDIGVIDEQGRIKITDRKKEDRKHTSELQSLMRISYAVFCLKKKTQKQINNTHK